MTDTTIQTDDGGHVTMTVDGSAGSYQVHLQKYDASGAPVGGVSQPYNSADAPQLVALAGGGYALGTDIPQRYGAVLSGYVFDASGARIGGFSGLTDWHLAASPLGGFVVTSIPGSPDFPPHPMTTSISLYDSTGHLVEQGPIQAYGSPTIAVGSDGVYQVHWSDGDLSHTLALDPRNPPDLTPPPAPGAYQLSDDQGPQTGMVSAGGATDDTTPTFRVPVTAVGAVAVTSSQSAPGAHFIAVTQADVDRGYVDVAVRSSRSDGTFADGQVTFSAVVEDADGIISSTTVETFTIDTQAPGAPQIVGIKDDQGPQTGDVVNGQTTDDTTPTVTVSFFNSGAHIGDTVVLHDTDGSELGRQTITNSNVGQTQFAFDTTLAYGTHTLTADIVRSTGAVGPDSAPISFTIQDPSTPPQDHAPAFKTVDGATVADGGTVSQIDVLEANFPQGTQPQNSLTVTRFGAIYLSAEDGLKDLTVDGHAVLTNGTFTSGGFQFGVNSIFFNDYDPASGKLSFTYGLRSPVQQAPGVDSTTFTLDAVLTDTDGDATHAQMAFRVIDDTVIANTDVNVAQIGAGAATGNLLTNDRGADGPALLGLAGATQSSSGYVVQGQFGVLTVNANGDYSYTANAGAQPGVEHFSYDIGDNDNDRATGSLQIDVRAQANASGSVITASRPGDTMTGGSGDDTINASQGPDVITTGGGADVVAFHDLPWSAGHVTDFTLGTDHLDFSALFAAAGYAGSDPVADGRMSFQSNGSGGTAIYFDHDQTNGGDWPFRIVTLDHVSASGLTWAQLSAGGSPPPADAAPQLQDANHQTGQFNELGLTMVSESNLPYGTWPSAADLTKAGGFFVSSRDGVASLAINGHTVVDHGAFASASWGVNGLGTLTVTGYDAASGRVDYSFTLERAYDNTNGYPYVTTQEHVVVTDNDGDEAAGNFYIRVNDDGLRANDDAARAQAGGPAVSGDLLANDSSADGVQFAGFVVPPGANAYILTGEHGSLSVDASGRYTYRANTDATAGTDSFQYRVRTHEGDSTTATLTVTIDAANQPPPPGTITSPGPGSTVNGTSGDDTIYASQGPDVITTGAGADVVAFRDLPWNAGHVTDFAVGTDHLDLSAIFAASGYHGSDPVADGRMRFEDDGAGGTKVYFDRDAPNYGDWPFLITTLDHVSASGLTWAQLSASGSTGGSGGTGGSTSGQVITSDQYGDTLVGGSGNDTLNAGQGPDTLTGNGGGDHFTFNDLPWRAGVITDFTPGVDKLDLRPLFQAAGYSGSDPIADHHLEFRDDGQGGTAVYFDRDAPNAGDWPFFITTLQGVTPGQIGAGDWLFR